MQKIKKPPFFIEKTLFFRIMFAMSKPFVNLHTHSYYSVLEASASPADILKKAQSLGHQAVALTDNSAGYGLVEFYEASEKKGTVKPILGAEVYLATDSRFDQRSDRDGHEGNIVLLAQNKTGYTHLLKLLSLAHLEGYFRKPRVDFELLEKYASGLIVLTGSTIGALGKTWDQYGEKKAEELFQRLRTVFGEHLYLELVSHSVSFQKKLNLFKISLAEKYQTNLVVSCDARFMEKEDEEATDTLYCIGQNLKVDDPGRERFSKGNFFKDRPEIEKELSYIDKKVLDTAFENTVSIAQSVNFEMVFGQNLLPHFGVPQGETESSQLRKQCEEGILKRYGKTDETIQKRLDYELSVIGSMGFDAYFLIVADFIQFARKNGIAVGPGRGSAAGSLVAYLLEITNIDPLHYELLFERFLNPERISMPDIDIDFSDERREEVLQFVIEKYGIEKVSKVCTFGTLSAKAALKDVGRARGVAFAQMNKLTKMLPNKPGFKLDDALQIKEFKDILESDESIKKVFDIAHKLEGCVRHVSVHACAVIIGDEDLTQYTPIQHAPTSDDLKITQYPYQQLEHLGLLKMDFLGLKNLSVLEKTLQNIKKTRNIDLVLNDIPIQDPQTFEMLSEGHTTGVFQFESAGMRRYLKELRPTEIEDLVAMNALYRPGPMEYIPVYIKGKHDPGSVKYFDDSLQPILEKTYGIAVYQEQIMKIAQEFAGFTLGQADILRKAIGKKKMDLLAQQRAKFIEGAVKKGQKKKMAEKLFDDIVVPFSGYGFNRSHAVCYARIAYETAYLRANYPVEFMAAMMTTDRNNTDRIVLEMNECQAMGIEVLPPSINESGAHFTIIGPDENQMQVEEEEKLQRQKIRFGLTAIKGMGEDSVRQIIAQRREKGNFQSLQDFVKRIPLKLINKKTLEALAFSGALDEFADRGAIVESLEDLMHFAREHQEKSETGQMGLFGGSDASSIDFMLKEVKATKEDILRWERDSLGLFVSDHPLKGMDDYFKKYGKLIGLLSEEEDGGQKRTFHGMVTQVRKIMTRAGSQMAIIELEDTSGKIEGAIFPKVYETIPSKALEMDAFVRVRGKVDMREGNFNIIIDEMKVGDIGAVNAWQEKETQIKEKTFLEIVIPDKTLKKQVDKLKVFLNSQKIEGSQGIDVYVQIQGKKIKLPFKVKRMQNMEKRIKEILENV